MPKQTQTNSNGSKALTMEELLAKAAPIKGFSRGQRIEATLIEVGKNYATFDVGGKSEGILYDSYLGEARDLLSSLKPGDKVNAVVMDPETPDGTVLLSLRHAASDKFWESLEEAYEKDMPVVVMGRSASTKGVTVDLDALTAFIPLSQIGKKHLKNLDDLIGKRFKAKIIDVDKARKRVLLSEKAVSEEKELGEIKDAINTLPEGTICEGIVRELTSFGAFVEIKVKDITVEGLVHVSELSWLKIKHPSEILEEGQTIKVKVIGLREGKLALSLKQATTDPWEEASGKYSADQKLTGKVIRNSDYGTFVELEPGIEGLIHITKIPPATKLTPGQEVNVYVEEVDASNRKISLGLVLTSKPVGYR